MAASRLRRLEWATRTGTPLGPLQSSTALSNGRAGITRVLDLFHRDLLRMVVMLFAPMVAGVILIPLMLIVFSLLGYKYRPLAPSEGRNNTAPSLPLLVPGTAKGDL